MISDVIRHGLSRCIPWKTPGGIALSLALLLVGIAGCTNPGYTPLSNRKERFFEQGLTQYERGDYRDAAASFNKYLSYEPNVHGYHLRGRSRVEMGEDDLALADYRKALDLDPANVYVRRALGWLYFSRFKFDKAALEYEQAFMDRPSEPESLSFGAWSALGAGNFPKALEFVRLAQRELNWHDKDKLDGNDAAYNAIVAYIALNALGQPERAKAYLKLAIRFSDYTVWPYDAMLYFDGRISREDLLASTLSNGASTEAHTYLAIDAILKGDEELAKQHLDWVAENGDEIYYEYYIALALRDGRLSIKPE